MTRPGRPVRVTQADVARAAGVSTAVVSYVINEGPRPIAAATRERVLRAMAETGYRPNGVARALVSGATRTLGLVVPELANQFFATLAHALETEASRHGLVLVLGDSGQSVDRESTLVETFVDRRVDGLIYVGVGAHDAIEIATSAGTPVVVLDRVADDDRAASVVIDNVQGAAVATRHLIEHGRRALGCLLGPETVPTARARHAGWQQAVHDAGGRVDPRLVEWAPFSKEGGYRAGLRMLRLASPPDGMFVASEDQALGLLCAAAELGVAVPGSLAVVSFDGTDSSRFSVPPLTTVAPRFTDIARRTIELLRSPDVPPRSETSTTDLVVRSSCGCP
ncbi:LacI family DNA-binding transcriptional regulator [Pseudonocardia nematodicida]|uniref:LacI family DNA-binding transcriptional regulator n=1 Tax=Pseudonocardia nematodicida TaxID=1206997 RepID=A0ABV1K3J8_9PSEU